MEGTSPKSAKFTDDSVMHYEIVGVLGGSACLAGKFGTKTMGTEDLWKTFYH
jgi:hypothetical protein